MGTQRSKADLDALYPDNSGGAISPADLRDFLESAQPSMVGMHFESPGPVTAIAAISTFVKAENDSVMHAAKRFSMPADNRLQYDGTVPNNITVLLAVGIKCEADDQNLALAIAINGLVDEDTVVRYHHGVGADMQAVTLLAHPLLDPGDYLEVWVANETSAADITIDHGHVQLIGSLT